LDAEGDFTSFNVDRVRDHAKFDLTLTPRASLDFDFNRYTRTGDSTTQLDIQREIFELDRPINEINNEFGVAFQYRWDKVALVLQEQIRDFENAYEVFLPGSTDGTNPDNDSAQPESRQRKTPVLGGRRRRRQPHAPGHDGGRDDDPWHDSATDGRVLYRHGGDGHGRVAGGH